MGYVSYYEILVMPFLLHSHVPDQPALDGGSDFSIDNTTAGV